MPVDRPGVEPGSPPRQGGIVPLDHQPIASVDLIGVEPNTVRVQTRLASNGMQAQLVERSVRESNPIFVLTTDACGRNTYRPSCASDPGWNRTSTFLHVTQASSPLDHGIKLSVTRVGVEPTKSQVLGLLALPVCVPCRLGSRLLSVHLRPEA